MYESDNACTPMKHASMKDDVESPIRTVNVDGKGIIEFEFNCVPKPDGYEDIIISIINPEFQHLCSSPLNPLFIRDNTLYPYYKTNDKEYIRIIDAIGFVIAETYNLKVIRD
ncbi:MAG TPA: hypothetical protein VN958_06030 [Chitinophagaceae bacterium]|nr:hypothetical protein [Chitinophagaceae bacterium]